jgi:hypothetical protein
MRTEQLIADLASDVRPVPWPAWRLSLAMIAGWALALIGLIAAFGSPLDPVAQRGLAASAMKLLYPLIIAVFGAAAALAAGRPGDRSRWRLAPIGVAIVITIVLAAIELAAAPPVARDELMFGTTLARCVTSVALASIPVFVGLTWAFRLLAPTRPAFAGFLIGLASGGAAAAAYALFCPELSKAFLITAYTPAMLIPAVLGAIAGPRLLRW